MEGKLTALGMCAEPKGSNPRSHTTPSASWAQSIQVGQQMVRVESVRNSDQRLGPGVIWAEASWRRNRRESDSLSPLKWVPLPALLLSSVEMVPPKHPHVNPPPPPFKIPHAEWPRVVQRVAQGESLRQVARSYRVSYEAIRRILVAARRSHEHDEEEPLE
jgi:hypothetical protein